MQRSRYPGAQPFADDGFSHKLFFGRDEAATLLTNKILSNRLLVLYARSGSGKTSLLNAGVAPRLRDEGYIPLMVRCNDIVNGPITSVMVGAAEEARRQAVEYVPGRDDSLWAFFKTAEFWRGDVLLRPVLILDQFEELFTLQDESRRQEFLSQLSNLVRSVCPEEHQHDEALAGPLTLHIVLSLREDYLGLLEEAADYFAEVLDHRFRLTPLTLEKAAEAMTAPATVVDAGLATRPFHFDRDVVKAVLAHVSRRRTLAAGPANRDVEPVHLQIICRKLESLILAPGRQAQRADRISLEDLGGASGLDDALAHFYRDAIAALPGFRSRRAARALCELSLISPEGRRLSLEEDEIHARLGISKATLMQLTESRLLRYETRAGCRYCELSHDALIEPVLRRRRVVARVSAWVRLTWSMVVLLVALLFARSLLDTVMRTDGGVRMWVVVVFGLVCVMMPGLAMRTLQQSIQDLKRYGRHERGRSTSSAAPPWQWLSMFGMLSGALLVALGVFAIIDSIACVASLGQMTAPWWYNPSERWPLFRENGIGVDWLLQIVAEVAGGVLGIDLFRWCGKSFGMTPKTIEFDRATQQMPIRATRIRAATGDTAAAFVLGPGALLCAAVSGFFLVVHIRCGYFSNGALPAWFPTQGFTFFPDDCRSAPTSGLAPMAVFEHAFATAVFLVYGVTRVVRFRSKRRLGSLRELEIAET